MKKVIIDMERLKGALWGKQPCIAGALGIHTKTFNRKVNNKSRLHLDELNIIAETLGRDTTDFLKVVEVPPSTDEWFLSDEWQKGEREADEDIAQGNLIGPFDNIDDALHALKTVKV